MNELNQNSIGLIGLGLVGTALAHRFQNAGFSVVGFDTNADRRDELKSRGVDIAAHAREVSERTSRIVFSLPDSHCVKDVLFGDGGVGEGGLQNKLIVDTTTGDPVLTEEIAEKVQAANGSYVDACIIGSSRQVREGDVVVTLGGAKGDVERCGDIFDSFSNNVFHMGLPGKGMQTKLVANLVLGLHRFVLSEGLLFAESLGLPLPNILEMLKAGVSYSRVMDTKGEKMVSGDFKPEARMAQHLKDVNLIMEMGKRTGANLPLSKIHRDLLQQGVDEGQGDLDNSAVIEILRRFEKKDYK